MQGRRRQFRATEREGIAQVAFLVSRLGWIWREQPIADFGVDGYIEIVKDKMPSGELIGVQVKAGKYYFKSKGPVCRLKVTNEHMEYWSHHNLSIIVILYNPETKSTIWEWARVEYARAAKNGWIIEVPKNQEFSRSADWNLRNSQHTSSSIALRRRFALDIELIKKFSKHDIYISFDVWVNKTLSFRGIEVRFDDQYKENTDFNFDFMADWGWSMSELMWHFLPWLEYENIDDDGPTDISGEVEVYRYYANVSEVALAYLKVEEFFEKMKDFVPSEEEEYLPDILDQ